MMSEVKEILKYFEFEIAKCFKCNGKALKSWGMEKPLFKVHHWAVSKHTKPYLYYGNSLRTPLLKIWICDDCAYDYYNFHSNYQ